MAEVGQPFQVFGKCLAHDRLTKGRQLIMVEVGKVSPNCWIHVGIQKLLAVLKS